MKKEILNELRELIPQIKEYYEKFGDTDIRASFLDGYFQILRTYFCSYYHLESDDILAKYREIYPDKDFSHNSIKWHCQGHKNLLNSYLILNSWSNFELCITLMANAILDENTKARLLSIEYRRIRKCLRDILTRIEISDSVINKLKKFNKFHLAHVPMVNKYGNLFKLLIRYPNDRDKKNDGKFLEFYGRLRNCVHSNYIYYGRNLFKYTFREVNFRFTHGELVHQEPITENVIFLMSIKLKRIFMAIAENIDYFEEIPDPSHRLIS